MWPFILLHVHVMSRYMFIWTLWCFICYFQIHTFYMDTLMFYMLFSDTCLYGHFDVLYVISRYMFISWTLWCFICYFQIHVYIMDTLMFYILFLDTCLYHGHFDVLYVISRDMFIWRFWCFIYVISRHLIHDLFLYIWYGYIILQIYVHACYWSCNVHMCILLIF